MKHFFSLTLLAFLFMGGVSAQQDTKAKEILDKVSENTRSFSAIKAQFSFSMENPEEGINEQNEGRLWLKGDKYKVEIMGVESYCDGKNVWTYMPDAGEVNITTMDTNNEDALNPAKILTIYENGFNYKFIEETTDNNRPVYIIDLFPNKESDLARVRLKIHKENLQLLTVHAYANDGNLYSVIVKTFDTNLPVEDSNFIFDTSKHPDVEVIDMR